MRRLAAADLEQCLDVASSVGWPRERAKWRLLLELGKGFGIEGPAGRLIGTAVATRFGGLSAIGMVLVDARHGRRGHGTELVRAVLGAEPDARAFLFATAQGRPLYEKLGFRSVGTIAKHVGRFDGLPLTPAIRAATAEDLTALERLDVEALGVPRGPLLAAFLRQGAGGVVAVDAAGRPIGFALSWDNETLRMLGPVVADGEETARALVTALARAAPGTVRVDIPDGQPGLRSWAKGVGLEPLPESPLMTVDGAPLPGNRAHLFAIAAQALG